MMIVMELVESMSFHDSITFYWTEILFFFTGGSLNSYVKENDLRVYQLTAMCCDIAKGMAYLESNNVIHRYDVSQ